MGLGTTALAALFLFVNVHGAVKGVVHLAGSYISGGLVPQELVADLDTREGPADSGDDSEEPEEESPPPPPSGLDEDDVKHCSSLDWLTWLGGDLRVMARHRDERAHDHEHREDLERPPRA